MDPNTLLDEILRLARSEGSELASKVDDLDNWIVNGGFAPDRWACGEAGCPCCGSRGEFTGGDRTLDCGCPESIVNDEGHQSGCRVHAEERGRRLAAEYGERWQAH